MDKLEAFFDPPFLQHVQSSLHRYVLAGIAALFSVLVVLIIRKAGHTSSHKLVAYKSPKTATILFVGPMGSGKTSFFGRVSFRTSFSLVIQLDLTVDAQLVYHYPPATHTSMASSTAILPEKHVQLIDLPGHPRIRSHLLAQQLSHCSGVAFFIDPTLNGNTQGIKTTAEHLHVVLSLMRILDEKSNGRKRPPPLLVLLTKSDTWTTVQKQRAQDRIRSTLERELSKRRKVSSGGAVAQARLESIEELPSGSSSNPFNFLGIFSRSSRSAAVGIAVPSGGIELPEDEQEILQSDVLEYDGAFSWDEDKLGISISWATSSSKPPVLIGKKDDSKEKQDLDLGDDMDAGTTGFWQWVDEKVL